jgi:hypothetical protein
VRLTYLAEVELRVLLSADTLDLNEGGVRASVTLSTLVSENTALAVEASRTYYMSDRVSICRILEAMNASYAGSLGCH